MGTVALLRHMSVEEYLDAETCSDVRHEYLAGEVFAMVGSTTQHYRVLRSLRHRMEAHLHGTGCEVFSQDVRLRVKAADSIYYPDIFVSCRPPKGSAALVDNAVLIIEVLSQSTEATDRREKRIAYAKLPDLREYALIAQDQRKIEVFRRTASGEWELQTYTGENELEFTSIDLTVPLAAIYREAGID